jgi:creatinine amidohydrolase
MFWDRLRYGQIERLDRNIPVLLPVAATEQHGPHLPLATDRLIGEHFAAALEALIPERILVLPAVSIGCSGHHMGFAGSLSLQHATFASVVKDIIASVLQHGFQKVIILNSHGGNQAIMQVIVEEMGQRYDEAYIVGVTWWMIARGALKDITEAGAGGTGHACEFETSLMECIAPELIDKTQIRVGSNKRSFSWAEGDMLRGARASYYRSMEEMTSNGVFGDPTKASAEKGRRITVAVTEALGEVAASLYTAPAKGPDIHR